MNKIAFKRLSSELISQIENLPSKEKNEIKVQTLNSILSESSTEIKQQLGEDTLNAIKEYMEENNIKDIDSPKKTKASLNAKKIFSIFLEKLSSSPITSIKLLANALLAKDFEDLYQAALINKTEVEKTLGPAANLILAGVSSITLYEFKGLVWAYLVNKFNLLFLSVMSSSGVVLVPWLLGAWFIGVVFGKEKIKNFLLKSLMLIANLPITIITDITNGFKWLLETVKNFDFESSLDSPKYLVSRI
jgi:hypothetical protein